MTLKGAPELVRRLKAVRLAFKPIGRRWADRAVPIGRAQVPVRPASTRAGDGHEPGRLRASIRRKSATQRKAVVVGHYSAYFVDHGVQPHAVTKGSRVRGSGTIFAKKGIHPGYRAHPFRARMAREALEQPMMSNELIRVWNDAA